VFKGKGFDDSKVKCFNCNKMGHFAKDFGLKRKAFIRKGSITLPLLKMKNQGKDKKDLLVKRRKEKNTI
jgi:hypothetical protein